MARQLWLLRHAEAEPHGTRPDSQRRLTPRGEQQARAAGVAIQQLAVAFDEIDSPKVRARATAQLAAEGWSAPQRALLREHPSLAGGFGASLAIAALSAVPVREGRLLLVGHEPDLSLTVGELTGGRIDLKKGGLAVVRLKGGGGGGGGGSDGGGGSEERLGDDGAIGELALLLRSRELAHHRRPHANRPRLRRCILLAPPAAPADAMSTSSSPAATSAPPARPASRDSAAKR